MTSGREILTVAEMYRADAHAIVSGISGIRLMEAAGNAVAGAIRDRWAPRPVVVLCGPGNNGGDGFVIARRLAEAGWSVRVALLGALDRLKGDAAAAAARWSGPIEALTPDAVEGKDLVVDALFGAGLSRPLDGMVRAVVEALADNGRTVVAVDVPSGVEGDTGRVLGCAAPAALTVTFFRKKPGHLLLPGRVLAGEVVVADIGIPATVLEDVRPRLWENHPDLWLDVFPWPRLDGHKYDRGHAVVLGGARMTGAARLAARGAMRAGAGLVTVACPPESQFVYALSLPSALVVPVALDAEFHALLDDPRKNAVLLGPGGGISETLRERVRATLDAGKHTVLDADALTAFADAPEGLMPRLSARCLLTPHGGEFRRLFDIAGDKLVQAQEAARRSGAVVLLKGADTVIAAPPDGDGVSRAVINTNAPPDLATAGAGDVLSGLAVGLMAQGLNTYQSACAAAWIHGEAAAEFGPGLIAEDLPESVPAVLRRLREKKSARPADPRCR